MQSRILALYFPKRLSNAPIVVNLVKDYNLTFNILKAAINPRKEGFLVLELTGTRKEFQKGVKYLKEIGIKVERVGQDIRRDDTKCYQCGACTAVCPTGALSIRRPEMEVVFDSQRCSACEACVAACPAGAMEVTFDRNLIA